MPSGRIGCPRRAAYMKQFNLTPKMRAWLTQAIMDQLDRCKSDDERLILARRMHPVRIKK